MDNLYSTKDTLFASLLYKSLLNIFILVPKINPSSNGIDRPNKKLSSVLAKISIIIEVIFSHFLFMPVKMYLPLQLMTV